MEEKVKIPQEVYEGIVAVRASGLTNMLDMGMVAHYACELGFPDAADWLSDANNKRRYSEGIFKGFEPEEDSEKE